MRTTLAAVCVLILGTALLPSAGRPAPRPARAEPHRSPADLALLPGGRALTANHGSDSLSLVDLAAGKVLAEAPCGRRPVAVACSADGRRAAVSNLWSGTLSLFAMDGPALRPAGRVAVGPFPRGLAFAPGGQLYAAVAGSDEVVTVDWSSRKVTRRRP